MFMEDCYEQGGAVEVMVGEDCPDHLHRCETLRVWPDGRVERQTYDDQGEFLWVADTVSPRASAQ